MSDRYAVLHYRGDRRELAKGLKVTRSDGGTERTVPVLLGSDAVGLPYEVLDVELLLELVPTGVAGVYVDERRTRVHLGPASPDTVRGNRSAAFHQREQHLAQLVDHARARHFWRPDIWAAPASDQSRAALEDRLAATERAKASA